MAPVTTKHCDKCNKDVSTSNWNKHIRTKTHKGTSTRNGGTSKEKQKRETKSKHFFITIQKACKYEMLKKYTYLPHACRLLAGNEWGITGRNGHTHVYIETVDKIEFVQSSNYGGFPEKGDIQSCKNINNTIRYLSKEDHKCIMQGIDHDLLSLGCKAWITAKRFGGLQKLPATSYPYCNLPVHQKKAFLEIYEVYAKENREDMQREMYDEHNLQKWQKNAIRQLMGTNDRQIMWLYDEKGGAGKTFLCKYLCATKGAAIFQNGSTREISYAYNKEHIVCFNYTRDDEICLNYPILENLKDGYCFSSKYDSSTKHFDSPKLLCCANFRPNTSKLCHDRLYNFKLEYDNVKELYKMKIDNPFD